MITPSTIYWIGQCDQIRCILGPAAVIGLLFAIFLTIGAVCSTFDRSTPLFLRNLLFVLAPLSWAVMFVAVIGLLFIPTTKTVAAMYVVPAIVNNEKLNDAGDRLYVLATEWMEELRPAKNKEGEAK
jgi:hypothetical protein